MNLNIKKDKIVGLSQLKSKIEITKTTLNKGSFSYLNFLVIFSC